MSGAYFDEVPSVRWTVKAPCREKERRWAEEYRAIMGPSDRVKARGGSMKAAPAINDEITARCTQIADAVVPAYRDGKRSYSCTGRVAKRWQAAWDDACIALGREPGRYRIPSMEGA